MASGSVVTLTLLSLLCVSSVTSSTTLNSLSVECQELKNEMQGLISGYQNLTLPQVQEKICRLEKCMKCSLESRNSCGLPKDCQEVWNQGNRTSGIYTISPDGITVMDVYCDHDEDGGGWTVFQRRVDGSVDFYRTWAEYKHGFGNLNGNFWLGNDNLHVLTKDHNKKLRIVLKYHNETATPDYSHFWIDGECLKYKLTVSGYSVSPAGSSFTRGNSMAFSTKDNDNDIISRSCADLYKGGWWYKDCHLCNLNGVYGATTYGVGINWSRWKGFRVSMTSTEMMVKNRP